MKKCVIFLVILLVYAGNLQGQSTILDKRIRIDSREGTAGILLEEISRKGGFDFSHNGEIPLEKQVRLQYRHQTVHQFLFEIFEGEVYCIEYGKKIHIKKKPVIPEVYSVSGKVIDSGSGEPVPGVTVIIPGTEPDLIGAASDAEGVFRINVPLGMDAIQFSCIGYENQSFSLEQPIPEEIELIPASLEISEVVIHNPLVIQESSVSVSYLSADRIKPIPGSSLENVLIGAVSGVHVVRNSGMPGSSYQVKIRGTQSLINSDPVYYLDGIPIQGALLNAVSPHDISSMEINKDASSTARYGARAGNGVILLNSKEGNSEEIRVNFDYHIGVQQAWKKLDLMDGGQFMDYAEKVIPQQTWLDERDSIVETANWQDIVFHPAKTEDCHLSIRGGDDHSSYYLGTGFFNQASIVNELKLTRYSFKFSSDHRIKQKWEISQDIALAHIRHDGLKEGCFLNDYNNPILASLCLLPTAPAMDAMPDIAAMINIPEDSLQIGEPAIQYLDAELTENVRKNYAVFGNLTSGINLTQNLDLQTILGYEVLYQNNISNNRTLPVNIALTYNPVLENNYKVLDLGIHIQNFLRFRQTFADHHDLETMAGFEYGQNENEWTPVSQTIANLAIPSDSVSTITNSNLNNRYSVGIQNRAFTGSISYAYKNRYILNGSLRREVISFDADTTKKDFTDLYPSLSLAWIFMNRSLSPGGFLQFGKLRYAYGMAGNSPRLDYSLFAGYMRDIAYVYSFTSSGSITNSAQQRQANELFFWEKTSAHNLGIELGFMQNRLFLTTDLFYNRSYMGETSEYNDPLDYVGQLYAKDLFGIIQLPLAEMLNYGIEGQLNYKKVGRMIQWDISLNLCHLRNRIMAVEDQNFSNFADPIVLHRKGESAGSFYGYRIERLFNETDCPPPGRYVTNQPYITENNGRRVYAQPYARPGDYKFMDINGDSVIDQNDKTVLGDPYPDLTFGLYVNARFRQFDFTMFWQGIYGNEIYNATRLWLYNPYGSSNWTTDILNSYRSPEYNQQGEIDDPGLTDTDLHRFDYLAENKNLRVSDFYVEDGSYLRLKNIQLGYTLDPALTRRIHISSFRIYIAAQNLFTFTRYSGLDPEVGGWGIDCGIYPQPRTWYAGVNIEF